MNNVIITVNGNNIVDNLNNLTGKSNWEVQYKGVPYGIDLNATKIINVISNICNERSINIPNAIDLWNEGEKDKYTGTCGYIEIVNNTGKLEIEYNGSYKDKNNKNHGIAIGYVFQAINKVLIALEKENAGLDKGEFVFISYANKQSSLGSRKTARTENARTTSVDIQSSTIEEFSKNIILYGPPGTGKTRYAKILAVKIVDRQNPLTDDEALEKYKQYLSDGQIKLVQFHPSYSYFDFVEGIEATDGGFVPKSKFFRQICEAAANAKSIEAQTAVNRDVENVPTVPNMPQKPNYVLIIDEINRADIASVLGELLYGLEYRESEIETALTGEKSGEKTIPLLYVPDNLYIIGTMNTADQSIAGLDYAIRRRFAFVNIPSKEIASENFSKMLYNKVKADLYAAVARGVNAEDIMPGHSNFMFGKDIKDKDYGYKIEFELMPLLKEYVKSGLISKRYKIKITESSIEKSYAEAILDGAYQSELINLKNKE